MQLNNINLNLDYLKKNAIDIREKGLSADLELNSGRVFKSNVMEEHTVKFIKNKVLINESTG